MASYSSIAIVAVVALLSIAVYYILDSSKKKMRTTLRTLLDPNEVVKLPLAEKKVVSHDTRLFRFALPTKQHSLGLPIGQHVKLSAEINGETVQRSYTPVSLDDELGFMDLVIKVYFRNVNPKFPDGGKMTQFLEAMRIGDEIGVRGPIGRIQYKGNGHFSIKVKDVFKDVSVKKVSMIAGGSGITPMYQIIKYVMNSSNDNTEIALLYANQSEKDILLRDELDAFSAKFPDKFKVWYTIDKATDNWKYSTGYINAEMISANLFGPSDDHLVLLCGPPGMLKFACVPNLQLLKHDDSRIFSY